MTCSGCDRSTDEIDGGPQAAAVGTAGEYASFRVRTGRHGIIGSFMRNREPRGPPELYSPRGNPAPHRARKGAGRERPPDKA